jgi:hypothetical protein
MNRAYRTPQQAASKWLAFYSYMLRMCLPFLMSLKNNRDEGKASSMPKNSYP